MKKTLLLLSLAFTLSSCNVKNKLLKYTGTNDSDRLGVPKQEVVEEKPKPTAVVVKKTDNKGAVDQKSCTEVLDVETENESITLNDPLPEIKSDTDYTFMLYIVGGLLIVWFAIKTLIKHKK